MIPVPQSSFWAPRASKRLNGGRGAVVVQVDDKYAPTGFQRLNHTGQAQPCLAGLGVAEHPIHLPCIEQAMTFGALTELRFRRFRNRSIQQSGNVHVERLFGVGSRFP